MRIRLVMSVITILLSLMLIPQTVSASTIVSNIYPAIGATGININVTLSVQVNVSDGTVFNWLIECSNGQSISGTNATNGTFRLNVTSLNYNTRYWWNIHINNENHAYYFNTKPTSGGGGDGGGEEHFIGDVSIFPETPISGEAFAVILGKRINTGGYVFVSGKVYALTITNGFGTITLDDSAYGDAYAWIYGENSSTYIKKTFQVKFGMQGALTMDAPSSLKVNDVMSLSLAIGGKAVGDITVQVTDPSGKDFNITTNSNGKASQIVNKVGLWLARCSFANQDVVDEITVKYQPLDITLDKESYVLGDDVRIETTADAIINIMRDNSIVLQSTALNGVLTFTPDESGSYQIQATIGNKQGTVTFDVSNVIEIQVFDLNNMQVGTVKAGERYMVKVVDYRNIPVSDFNYVSNGYEQIPLNGGVGFWTPTAGSEATLSLEDKTGFQSQSMTLNILGGAVGSSFSIDINIIIGLVVAIVIIVVLLYLMRNKLPAVKRLFSGFFKPKREIPF